VLVEACRSVASYQLRTRATIVGNLCNASPAGDTIGACLLLDGRLRVHGLEGFRWEPLNDFFQGPGQTRLKPGDVVTALQLPPSRHLASGTYVKLGRNDLSDLAIVGVTVLAYPAAELPSGFRFRIALAAVAPAPLVAVEAEAYLAENKPSEAAFEQAARLAQQACRPIDDVRGSARYRRAMVRNLTLQALRTTWKARVASLI
jgi:carbon-monoxide dehydrogenase medium subunit